MHCSVVNMHSKNLFLLHHHVLIKSIAQDEGTYCSNCDITNTSHKPDELQKTKCQNQFLKL